MLTPGGAVLVGAIAAVLSVCGFRFGHDGDGVMVVIMAIMKNDEHAADYHELQIQLRSTVKGLFINDVITFWGYPDPPLPLVIMS